MIDLLLSAVYSSAAVGVVACLISESKIMSPIRESLGWQLLYCPICLGFWLAVPSFIHGFAFYFAVVGFSNVWMLAILHTYEALDRTYDASSEVPEER